MIEGERVRVFGVQRAWRNENDRWTQYSGQSCACSARLLAGMLSFFDLRSVNIKSSYMST